MRFLLPILLFCAACSPDADDPAPADTGEASDVAFTDIGTDAGNGVDASTDPSDVGPDTMDTGRDAAVVATSSGTLAGQSDDEVWAFKGIPYAVAERFDRPRSTEWSETLDATNYGPVCPQLGNTAAEPNVSWGPQPPACSECTTASCRRYCWSEDCLNLNVWTPDTAGARPVMVWLHGGSYIYGSGSLYDGRNLAAAGDVVVVTINYRLGPLGMFAHPDLEESLNFGMLDEIAALRWVRENITAFGGDSGNVTVFGESAGGASVCSLVASDAARGLFDKAIMQSGTCAWYPRERPVERNTCANADACPELATIDAEGLYNCVSMDCLGLRISERLGCDTDADPIACLRSADAMELLRALPQNIGLQGGVLWERFIDDETLDEGPASALFNGTYNHVPMMLGTTRDEATIFFSPIGPDVTSVAAFDAYLSLWGACSDELAAIYPASNGREAREQYLRLLSDYFYTCPTNWNAQSLAYYQEDVWLYQFTHVPWAGKLDIDGTGFTLGAYHSAEVPYVFGNTTSPANDPSCIADANGDFRCCNTAGLCYEASDASLSEEILRRWTDFAQNADPGMSWPRYDAGQQHLALEPGMPVSQSLRGDVCDVWLDVISHFERASGACD